MSDKQCVVQQLALYGVTNNNTIERIVKEIAEKYVGDTRDCYAVAREHLNEWFNDADDSLSKGFAVYGVTDPDEIEKCKAEILANISDIEKKQVFASDANCLILKYLPQYFAK